MMAFRGAGLKNCVIDADVFAFRIQLCECLLEGLCAPDCGDLFQRGRGLREMFAKSTAQCGRAPNKHTAVPVVIAGGDKLSCSLLVRLLGEARDAEELGIKLVSGFDVTVASLSSRRLNPPDHDVSLFCGKFDRAPPDLVKLLLVADDMIGRKHADNGFRREALAQKCRQPDRWGGIARLRVYDTLLGR